MPHNAKRFWLLHRRQIVMTLKRIHSNCLRFVEITSSSPSRPELPMQTVNVFPVWGTISRTNWEFRLHAD